MNNAVIISLAVAVVLIAIILAVIIYNQMLLLNEVNKRLLLIAKESVDRERSTQEELTEALRALDSATNESAQAAVANTRTEAEEVFDPHNYNVEDYDNNL